MSEFMDEQAPTPQIKAFWPTALRLVRELGRFRIRLVVVAVASVLLQVAAPRVLGHAMDLIFAGVVGSQTPAGVSSGAVVEGLRAQGQGQLADMLSGMRFVPGSGIDFPALAQALLTVVGMYGLAAVFMWIQGRILNDLVMHVVYDLRRRVEAKVNALPLSYFDTRQRGDVLSRTTNDMDNVQQALQQAFAQLVYSLLTIVGVGVMMFTISWQLALVTLVALPVSGVVVGIIGKRSQKLFGAQWKSTGELNGHVEESFTGHDVVRVFGRGPAMRERFDERNEAVYGAAFRAQFLSGMMMPIMQFVNYLGYVGIAVLGALKVANGQISLGAATAFIQYTRQFNEPIAQIAGMANMLQSGVASGERVFELLDEPEQPADVDAARDPEERVRGRIEFRDVDFSYTPDRPLIRDLSLRAEPGQTVAIVGPTGAGKTTLVNLIMRFYDVDAGAITLDGVDVRDMTRDRLRQSTGMVLQDAVLFEGSILENIRYGRLDASDEEVLAAARATYVDRFVRALPEGYGTVIDQEGGAISAGERQLITIARAFLADPAVLILDEATSSVDTRTEVLVQRAMSALRAQRTSFVIAHRLSTIRDADTILVMEAGEIVEQGGHLELMEAHGPYRALYESQFAAAQAVEAPDGVEPGSLGSPGAAETGAVEGGHRAT
ncbi:ABC transporter ATP-binding protein/permease [Rothia sp. AR01]|uniref:Fatty acid ABC transporter ATP-binding/permease protein n=1 Tax=Rothia santali TaxID=2949643 RepID=A0A9X2HJR5_9MICC|nr:ABC transporter ATP-binding protein [Rothia santali]MCP3427006.1 ABC transporter ATP-binding protein/permease [Rothia santali]